MPLKLGLICSALLIMPIIGLTLFCSIPFFIKKMLSSKKSRMIMNNDNINLDNIHSMTFAGGGCNTVYYFGVLKYICENSEKFKETVFIGSSMGCISAFIAAGIVSMDDDNERNRFYERGVRMLKELRDIGDNTKPNPWKVYSAFKNHIIDYFNSLHNEHNLQDRIHLIKDKKKIGVTKAEGLFSVKNMIIDKRI